MIKSMTGYGGAKGTSDKIEISIELKSVNSRYLDCTIKLPRVYIAFEEPIKQAIQKHISRGKVDVFVTIDSSSADDVEIKVNHALAEGYLSALASLAEKYSISGDINAAALIRFPDILVASKREVDKDRLCTDICTFLEEALAGFDSMRSSEGEKLCGDISARLDDIEILTKAASEASEKSVEEYRKKLETRMKEILQTTDIDEQRILTEAAIFADRVAINEETVRLLSHTSQLREMLRGSEPVGRKLDFLIQELNREANTIGSKGNDSEIARITVDLKAEIEKIREQAQNIE